jgi:hypothetical protein
MKSITLICIVSFILSSLLSAQDTVSVKQTTKQKKLKAGIAVNGFYSQYRLKGFNEVFETAPGYALNSFIIFNILQNNFGESVFIESGFGYRHTQSLPYLKGYTIGYQDKIYIAGYLRENFIYLPIKIGGSFNAMGVHWICNIGFDYFVMPKQINHMAYNTSPGRFNKLHRNNSIEFGVRTSKIKYLDSVNLMYMKCIEDYWGYYHTYLGMSLKVHLL